VLQTDWQILPSVNAAHDVVYLSPMTNSWQVVKSRLGPIHFLDLTGFDLVNAHFELGKQVKDQVWETLEKRVLASNPERLSMRIQQTRGCWDHMQNCLKRQDIFDPLKSAIRDYITCLEAWSEGIELARFTHPSLKSSKAGSQALSSLELGLILQHDNVGCQTGMYRLPSGAVQLWHTEEDVDRDSGSRFDKLRIASFQTGNSGQNVQLHAFVYPDLMPGPAFCWRSDGYVQAVDSLLLYNPPAIANGLLANIVSWLGLRTGFSINTLDMLELLQPFYDGYAMNVIWYHEKKVNAVKYEFAGDRLLKTDLDTAPGSYLFQVNYCSDASDSGFEAMEALPWHLKMAMKKRVERTKKALEEYQNENGKTGIPTSFFLRLISSKAGKTWAYANKDVKGYFVCQTRPTEMEILVGAGPAGRRDDPLKINQTIV
jgi:hypothetical protein